MIKIRKNIFYRLFILFFAFTGLIDSVNGFVTKTLGMNSIVGEFIRLIILSVLLIIMITHQKRNKFSFSYLLIYSLVLLQLIYGFIAPGSLVNNLLDVSKLIYIVVIIKTFINLFDEHKLGLDVIDQIFNMSSLIYVLLIIVPKILGIGYPMYESTNTGYSGLFYSANDLNLVLLVILAFSIDGLFSKIKMGQKYKYYMITSTMLMICLLLTGSKSSTIFGLLIVAIYLIKFLFTSHIMTSFKILFMLGILFGTGYFIVSHFYITAVQDALNRHLYMYQQAGNNTSTFLLTGRNSFLNASIKAYYSSTHPVLKGLFGEGLEQHMYDTGKNLGVMQKNDEMDFFDVFFSYGLVGLSFIYFYFSKYVIWAIKSIKINFKYSFSLIIVVIYSFFGGHVLFDALSGTYLALLCCGIYAINRKEKPKLAVKKDQFIDQAIAN